MITVIRTDPNKFGTTMEKLKVLEKMLQKIEGTVLEGAIFKVFKKIYLSASVFQHDSNPFFFFFFFFPCPPELVRAAV